MARLITFRDAVVTLALVTTFSASAITGGAGLASAGVDDWHRGGRDGGTNVIALDTASDNETSAKLVVCACSEKEEHEGLTL